MAHEGYAEDERATLEHDEHESLTWKEECKDLVVWGTPPFCHRISRKYRYFTRADVDSFFALFLDNLSSMLGILGAMVEVGQIARDCFGPPETCATTEVNADGVVVILDPPEWNGICPVSDATTDDGINFTFNGATGSACPGMYVQEWNDMVFGKICPGIAFALLFGNLWYAWMAGKLAAYEDRIDVTALPYGVNTPAGFLSAYSIMLPLAFKDFTQPNPQTWAEDVWKGACSAIFICGLFEIAGIAIGNFFRRNLSRAALYGPITAVGFVYLAFIPVIDFAREPFIGILPFAMCWLGFFANGGHGIYPPALTSVTMLAVGTALKWLNVGKFNPDRDDMADAVQSNWDNYAGKNSMGAFITLEGMRDVGDSISIVLPVALQSFIETMENVDLAAALGDSYNIREAMLADGLGTCIGALFGATLPTTVYIGHIRHKRLGATAGYSIANGIIYFILLMSGIFPAIYEIVDPVSVGMILLFVGLIVVQTSFERSAPRHYPALCTGLFFVIADPWFFDMFGPGSSAFSEPCTRNLNRYYGLANMMPGGGILVSLVLTQIICDMIDLRFVRGAIYAAAAAILSEFGFMHGNNPVKGEGDAVREGGIVVEGSAEAATERGQVLTSYIDGDSYKQLAVYPEGFRPPVDVNASYGLNESWRWAGAYAFLCLFLLCHIPFQRMGKIPPSINDNGAVYEETALQAAANLKKKERELAARQAGENDAVNPVADKASAAQEVDSVVPAPGVSETV